MTFPVRYLIAFAAIGFTAAITSCTSSGPQAQARSGSTPLPHSSSAGATAPVQSRLQVGYQRIGSAAQGVSVEVPASWVAIDFSHQTVTQAVGIVGAHGAQQAALIQQLDPLAKLRAVYAADVSPPGQAATSLNAYCSSSGISLTGSVGAAVIGRSWATQLQQDGAQDLSQTAATLGSVAGVRSSYTLAAGSTGLVHAVQLEVLPRPGRACFVTLAAAGQVPGPVLAQVISTIQYP
jgi:hypothetical protein